MATKTTTKFFLYIILLAAGSLSSPAQVPGLTRFDLNTGGNSFPYYLTPFNAANGGKICFWANDGGVQGWELYTCDGTHTPVLVFDVYAGSGSSIGFSSHHPTAVINGTMYYTGDNGSTGPELFQFNGATMPTVAKDIVPGVQGSDPDDYAMLSGTLYFRARTTTFGYELYSYDPASGNVSRLTDINPGPDSSINGNIIAYNNKIFFTADSDLNNNELYAYDMFGGANMISDIRPGTTGSFPQNLTIINNKLYFSADDGAHGRELWVYSGTGLPARATDVVSGFLSGMPNKDEPIIAGMGSKVYFSGLDTTSGKYLLFAYDPATGNAAIAPNSAGSSDPQWLTPYGGKLFYSAFNDTLGYELWAYDSTGGTKLVMDLCPVDSAGSNPEQFTVIGNDLYFKATQCNGVGNEVFRYNYLEVTVKNVRFTGDVKLYPNPATDHINISLLLNKPEALHMVFTDAAGRTVHSADIADGTTTASVSTTSWAPGMYSYALYNSQGVKYMAGKVAIQ